MELIRATRQCIRGEYAPLADVVDNVPRLSRRLRKNADPNKISSHGELPLNCAVETSAEAVKVLLDAKADPNFRDKWGYAALFVACKKNRDLETIKLLLAHGAKVNIDHWEGGTPLHAAVTADDCSVELVKLLLDNGADPDLRDSNEDTSVLLAVRKSREAEMKGFRMTELQKSAIALRRAACRTNENAADSDRTIPKGGSAANQIAELLLSSSNTVQPYREKEDMGLTHIIDASRIEEIWNASKAKVAKSAKKCPLHAACMKGDTARVTELLKVKVDTLTDRHANIAEYWRTREGGGWEIDREKSNTGWLPLEIATIMNHPGIVRELLKHGVDPALRSRCVYQHVWYPWTALDLALLLKRHDIVGILLEHVGFPDKGNKLKTMSYFGMSLPAVEKIIGQGTNVNEKFVNGYTLLHYAAIFDAQEAASYLLEKGADSDARDKRGQTPRDLAHSAEMKTILKKDGILRIAGKWLDR